MDTWQFEKQSKLIKKKMENNDLQFETSVVQILEITKKDDNP